MSWWSFNGKLLSQIRTEVDTAEINNRSNIKTNKVLQFTTDGYFLREWDNLISVRQQTGIKTYLLKSCCNGKVNKAGGFVWRFKNNFDREFKEGDRIELTTTKKMPFDFFMLGLHIGDVILYREDHSIKATVCDKHHVLFNDTKLNLTQVMRLLRDSKHLPDLLQWWVYEGKLLSDIRVENDSKHKQETQLSLQFIKEE